MEYVLDILTVVYITLCTARENAIKLLPYDDYREAGFVPDLLMAMYEEVEDVRAYERIFLELYNIFDFYKKRGAAVNDIVASMREYRVPLLLAMTPKDVSDSFLVNTAVRLCQENYSYFCPFIGGVPDLGHLDEGYILKKKQLMISRYLRSIIREG